MAERLFWIACLLVAALGWGALALFTGQVPPAPSAYVIFLPVLGFATTFTLAPFVWSLARRLHLPGTGERMGLALRAALWGGIGVSVCVAMQLAHVFSWAAALTVGIVLALFESFLLQLRRQRRLRAERRGHAPTAPGPVVPAPRAPAASARRRPPL